MDYQVKVDNFEGPMDLLLFFIQRDKLNIYDIPIAHITKEFLDYMKMMDKMNFKDQVPGFCQSIGIPYPG